MKFRPELPAIARQNNGSPTCAACPGPSGRSGNCRADGTRSRNPRPGADATPTATMPGARQTLQQRTPPASRNSPNHVRSNKGQGRIPHTLRKAQPTSPDHESRSQSNGLIHLLPNNAPIWRVLTPHRKSTGQKPTFKAFRQQPLRAVQDRVPAHKNADCATRRQDAPDRFQAVRGMKPRNCDYWMRKNSSIRVERLMPAPHVGFSQFGIGPDHRSLNIARIVSIAMNIRSERSSRLRKPSRL